MAKVSRKNTAENIEREKKGLTLPLEKFNYLVLGVGVIALIIGYILMGSADHPDAFISKTLSPLILVFTYTVVIPVGIFYRSKKQI
ncbi:MAG: hypothetical protein KAR38_09815 [Calditrichia bacterium]|nr:hypothetical protein [Calditrichia bacterium]